jgi:hypothetical protein
MSSSDLIRWGGFAAMIGGWCGFWQGFFSVLYQKAL